MSEPAHVCFEECAQVIHAVLQHRDAIDPQTPGKTLIFVWIEPAIAEHIRMHHPAAEDLQPVVAFAEANFTFVALALDVDFQRWLSKREERWPETHLHVVDFEKSLAEFLEDPFQMAKMRTFVDHQALNLMKHRRMRLV